VAAENLATADLAENGAVEAADEPANVMVTPPHPTVMPAQEPVNATARPSGFPAFSEPSRVHLSTEFFFRDDESDLLLPQHLTRASHFAADDPAPKKKRGRPKGSKIKPRDPNADPPAECAATCRPQGAQGAGPSRPAETRQVRQIPPPGALSQTSCSARGIEDRPETSIATSYEFNPSMGGVLRARIHPAPPNLSRPCIAFSETPGPVLIPQTPDRWLTTGAPTTSAPAGRHRTGHRRPGVQRRVE
jgi:hypothetical protein